jgi:signal transduction histidine kinase
VFDAGVPYCRTSTHGRVLGLPSCIAAGFGVALACVLAAGFFSFLAVSARTSATAALTHTLGNQLAVEEIESAMLVSDVALDAYLATGEDRHLARHLRARGKIAPALVELRNHVKGEPDESGMFEGFEPDLQLALDEHVRALALLESEGRDAARRLRAAGDGLAALRRAKDALEALENHETVELAVRQGVRTRTVLVSNVVFTAALIGLVLLVFAGARLMRAEIAARERHAEEREAALAFQQRLVAVVGHDLRNPLTGVLAWGISLARVPGASEEVRRIGARVVGAARRMERLIRDLLDWSRVQAGVPVPVEPRDADVFDLCRIVAEELSPSAGGRIALSREGDTRAVVDPDRIEQVISNLVTNALKYGPPGRPVTLRVAGADAEVRVEVGDEGGGIPLADQAALFEAFRRRAGELHAAESLGLGLFIVRTLTEAHGGAVELSSRPGEGTTFAVRLPRVPRAADRAIAS